MKRGNRLSGVLHVLLHLAQREGPATSEELARAMDTHPVVFRRVMAGLRAHGYVLSEKGHGGGWMLSCDLAKVTLRDVYEALGAPPLLTMESHPEHRGCLVEAAVNAELDRSFRDAEQVLLSRLGEVTLSTLLRRVRRQAGRRRGSHHA